MFIRNKNARQNIVDKQVTLANFTDEENGLKVNKTFSMVTQQMRDQEQISDFLTTRSLTFILLIFYYVLFKVCLLKPDDRQNRVSKGAKLWARYRISMKQKNLDLKAF